MDRRSPWTGTSDERISHTFSRQPEADPNAPVSPATGSSDRSAQRGHAFPRHVWVNATGRPDDRHPGVLVDWRRDRGEWHALVTWVEGGGMRPAHTHVAWLRAEHVTPL